MTDEEIDELARDMVKGNRSVNWLARTIEKRVSAERDAALVDARRYRWLRDKAPKYPAAFESRIAVFPLRGPELDAAIDAAMESGNEA